MDLKRKKSGAFYKNSLNKDEIDKKSILRLDAYQRKHVENQVSLWMLILISM